MCLALLELTYIYTRKYSKCNVNKKSQIAIFFKLPIHMRKLFYVNCDGVPLKKEEKILFKPIHMLAFVWLI